jgi:NhaP-type Na+/H+ and K+/H+ antiporters
MGKSLVFIGLLIFAAHLFSMLFSKKKIPDVLFLMLIGIIIGPITHIIKPDFLGSASSIFTSIVLVVILFDAGVDISIAQVKSSWKATVSLSFTSALLSIIIVAFCCDMAGMSFINSLITGITLCCTASTVIIPLVNKLKVGKDTKTVLVLESAITDIICLIFGLAIIQSQAKGIMFNVGAIMGEIIASFVMAILIGFVAGLIWASLLQRIRKMENPIFLTPAFLFIVYGITEILGFSGAIAALAVGITISNLSYFNFSFIKRFGPDECPKFTDTERSFIGEIIFVLKTLFFVYIGICIPFESVSSLIIASIITFLLLIMRIFITKYSSPKSANSFDKSIISLMIPKGLASAVLASIPEQMGLEGGTQIKYIVYSTVFISILVCSIMIFIQEHSSKFARAQYLFFRKRNKNKTKTNNDPKQ